MDKGTPFTLTEKTGFEISNPVIPVIINDFRGQEFYNNSDLQSRTRFNLPAGVYFRVSGQFRRLVNPVVFPHNKLPKFERNKPYPYDYRVLSEKNPHKCTINYLTKTITFDPSIFKYSLPELYYILFHEFAHAKFKTETFADALAENLMLEKGFNPSQIASAPITSLSSRQFDRKRNTLQRLLNVKK